MSESSTLGEDIVCVYTTNLTRSDSSESSALRDNLVSVSISPLEPGDLVNDEVLVIMQWVLYGVMLTAISGFGIASNTINIICFVRQGLRDPVNVSLLGLAISDLACLVTSLSTGILCNPALQTVISVDIVDFVYIVLAPPHYLFTGLTCWITALITLERCLCIAIPVKVKSIITPKRVAVIIFCIFILLACTASPVFSASELSWIFSTEQNRTVLSLINAPYKDPVQQFSYSVNNGLIPFTAYFMIIVCTVTLVGKLRSKAKWRETCTTSVNTDATSKRDQRVAKMVMMISVLFIGCFTPICIFAVSLVAIPELSLDGPNQNLLFIYGGIGMIFESSNSSVNIFIYYHMSTRYRLILKNLFRCRKDGIRNRNDSLM